MISQHRKNHARTFLEHIFPEPFRDGFAEVRLLGDVEKNQCYGQRWYRSIDELVDDLDELIPLAEEKHACVAFSPALRSRKQGTKGAVLGDHNSVLRK